MHSSMQAVPIYWPLFTNELLLKPNTWESHGSPTFNTNLVHPGNVWADMASFLSLTYYISRLLECLLYRVWTRDLSCQNHETKPQCQLEYTSRTESGNRRWKGKATTMPVALQSTQCCDPKMGEWLQQIPEKPQRFVFKRVESSGAQRTAKLPCNKIDLTYSN